MTRWFAVERPDGAVDRRALFGLRADPVDGPEAYPHPGLLGECTGCGTCAAVCPTGACTVANLGVTAIVGVDPRACDGCGLCVQRCPERILAPAATLPGAEYALPRRLARVRVARCSECRALLDPGETGTCTACSSRRGMLDDIWSQLG